MIVRNVCNVCYKLRHLSLKFIVTDGIAYYSTTNQASGLTYQTGEDVVVRAQFINNSQLTNTLDTDFRAISDNWPVFAFAHNLGTVSSTTSAPVVFSVGHVRDPVIEYIIANGALQDRSYLFWTQFSSVADVVSSDEQSFVKLSS